MAKTNVPGARLLPGPAASARPGPRGADAAPASPPRPPQRPAAPQPPPATLPHPAAAELRAPGPGAGGVPERCAPHRALLRANNKCRARRLSLSPASPSRRRGGGRGSSVGTVCHLQDAPRPPAPALGAPRPAAAPTFRQRLQTSPLIKGAAPPAILRRSIKRRETQR